MLHMFVDIPSEYTGGTERKCWETTGRSTEKEGQCQCSCYGWESVTANINLSNVMELAKPKKNK